MPPRPPSAPAAPPPSPNVSLNPQTNTIISNSPLEKQNISISFNDIDKAVSTSGNVETINAPKNIERLEAIAAAAAEKRHLEDMADMAEDEEEGFTIGEPIQINNLAENIEVPNSFNSSNTSNLVKAIPLIPEIFIDCLTITPSNHPHLLLRLVTVPNSFPLVPSSSPILSVNSVGKGPSPTLVVYALVIPNT